MLYIVIEHFKGNAAAIYKRFQEKVRLMPDGLKHNDRVGLKQITTGVLN